MSKLKDYLIAREQNRVDARTTELEEIIREHTRQRMIDDALMGYGEYRSQYETNTGRRNKSKA